MSIRKEAQRRAPASELLAQAQDAVLLVLWATFCGCGARTGLPVPACVASVHDGGTNDIVCEVDWSSNSGTEHLQLVCTAIADDNESCMCSSDQTTQTTTVLVNSFACECMTAQQVAAACGFDLPM